MIEGGRDQREGKNTDSEISREQMEIETWNQRRAKTQRSADQIQLLSLKSTHMRSRWIHGTQIAASKASEEATQTRLPPPAADHKKPRKSKIERQQKQDSKRQEGE